MNTDTKDGNDSILLQFSKYVSLNVLGMIGLSCYILSDTFFVAKGLGANGLAALNLAIPIYSFINGIGLMIGMGGATRYSIQKGSGDKEEGNKVFSQATILTLAIAAFCTLIGIFFSNPISSLLGADRSIHQMTSIYIKIILMFSPMFLMNNVLICFVRNDGNPKTVTAAMVLGSFSNIAMDYVFVIIFKMGLFGAALSTGVSPMISLLILSSHFLCKKNNFIFVKVKVKYRRIQDICAIGISSFIFEVSSGIVMIIFNVIILKLQGNVGVAAYGVAVYFSSIAQSLKSFVISILRGFILIMPMAYLLANLFKMAGVWLAFPCAEAFTAIVAVVFLYKNADRNGQSNVDYD